ncbi:MAG: hypothetical protein ACFUZC_01485 [Chthoniobacteraceae bacterium]
MNNSVAPLEQQALNKVEVRAFLGIGPKVLQRMIWASRHGDRWLDFVSNHGGKPRMCVTFTAESARYALYDFHSHTLQNSALFRGV